MVQRATNLRMLVQHCRIGFCSGWPGLGRDADKDTGSFCLGFGSCLISSIVAFMGKLLEIGRAVRTGKSGT